MSVGMPELKAWQIWRVTMDGNQIAVGLHHRPIPGDRYTRAISCGTLDSRDYNSEEALVKAVEDKAWELVVIRDEYEKRRDWVRKNFS